MTKAEFIENVYLYVTGGQLNADTNIKREDIGAMLPVAINMTLLQETRIRRQESMSEWIGSSTGIDGDFLATFYEEVKFDSQRNLRYISPSVRIVPLPMNRGIDTISAMQGDTNFIPLRGQFEDVTLENVLSKTVRYWFETIGKQQIIFFRNIPTIIEKVILKAVVSANDLADDDEVPLPSGTEFAVLNLLRDWFTGEKQFPEDLRNNNSDGSSTINIQKNPLKP